MEFCDKMYLTKLLVGKQSYSHCIYKKKTNNFIYIYGRGLLIYWGQRDLVNPLNSASIHTLPSTRLRTDAPPQK